MARFFLTFDVLKDFFYAEYSTTKKTKLFKKKFHKIFMPYKHDIVIRLRNEKMFS